MVRWHERRRWIYWGLGLLIAANLVVYFGWVRGLAQRIQVDPTVLEQLEREVALRSAEVERLQRVREQAPHAAPRLDAFAHERLWSESVGFSRVAAELAEVASEAGVRIGRANYNTSQPKERPELVQVELSTSVAGNYSNLLSFMHGLERSERFYIIRDLNVGSSSGGRIRLDMSVVTYFRRGKA